MNLQSNMMFSERLKKILLAIAGLVIILEVIALVYFLRLKKHGFPFVRKFEGQSQIITAPTLPVRDGKWLYFSNFTDIRDLYFDEDGDIIWVGASGGLYKYSKSKNQIIKSYTGADGLPASPTALIKINGKVYIGMQGGIAILDTVSDRISGYLYDTVNDSFNHNIYHFVYDGSKLWASTFGGLRSYDLATGEWKNYEHRDGDFAISRGDVYLIDRAIVDDTVIWRMNKMDGKWRLDFQLPNTRTSWNYIDGNDRYVIASADSSSGPVLYYKDLKTNEWKRIDVHNGGKRIDFRKLTLTNDGRALFTFWDESKQNKLGVYDIDKGIYKEFAVNSIGVVGAQEGNVYLEPEDQSKVWFTSFGFVDLNNGKITSRLNEKQPLSFDNILAVRDQKILVNTDQGVGILDPFKNIFIKISDKYTRAAAWVGDTIWLDFTVEEEEGGPTAVELGRYNIKNGNLEIKDVSDQLGATRFYFVKDQQQADQNSVFIVQPKRRENETVGELALFNFADKKIAPLLETNHAPDNDNAAIYSEKYGILITDIQGITSFNPITKATASLETSFVPVQTSVNNGRLLVLSEEGTLYQFNDQSKTFVLLFAFTQPEMGRPNDFEIFGDNFVVRGATHLDKYEIGTSDIFRAIIVDPKGRLVKALGTSNGMMSVAYDQIVSDNQCLWFSSGGGIWGYCK